MNREKFECQRCGRCCKELLEGLFLTEEEVEEWSKHVVKSNYGRHLAISFADVLATGTADLFSHPTDKERKESDYLKRCPFLRKLPNKDKYKCLVWDIRPEACRVFPFEEDGEVRNDEKARLCPEVRRLYSNEGNNR